MYVFIYLFICVFILARYSSLPLLRQAARDALVATKRAADHAVTRDLHITLPLKTVGISQVVHFDRREQIRREQEEARRLAAAQARTPTEKTQFFL